MPRALLLVDHGSRCGEANQVFEEVARILRSRRPDLIVHAAHLELTGPTVRQGVAACVADGATEIVVHPLMLFPGRHVTRDIPAAVAAASAEYPDVEFRIAPPLGAHEKLGEIILERAGFL